MGSDTMTNASIPAFSRDIGKKKRTNRSAKLKNRKIDARREQWLSQVKNKDCKEPKGASSPPPVNEERNKSLGDSQTRSESEENEVLSLHESDLEVSINSQGSAVSGNLPTKDRPGSSSSSSSGFCLGKFSDDEDDEEEKDGCLDDWEAIADALIAVADDERHPNSEAEVLVESVTPKISSSNTLKSECKGMIPRAWRPDDAFRPQSLPNLSKNHSFPMNSGRLCGAGNWGCHNIIAQPSSCPICYEDLDLTDSSFLPCACGFRLCLFCHKRILEADGRCPGCRKPYDHLEGGNGGALPFRLARSCSMSTRS